jgi:hypothetical protein
MRGHAFNLRINTPYCKAYFWGLGLSDATPEQRAHYEIFGDGTGIRWPDIDEDLSVRGMLEGSPAKRHAR